MKTLLCSAICVLCICVSSTYGGDKVIVYKGSIATVYDSDRPRPIDMEGATKITILPKGQTVDTGAHESTMETRYPGYEIGRPVYNHPVIYNNGVGTVYTLNNYGE